MTRPRRLSGASVPRLKAHSDTYGHADVRSNFAMPVWRRQRGRFR
jgi:hypothetical protein